MQIELGTVISVVGGLLSIALTAYVALARYAIGQREQTLNDKLNRYAEHIDKLDVRINVEEKSTIRQDGDLALVKQNHDQVQSDIEEVKRTMITKAEFEPRMTNLERLVNQVLTELRGISTRYSSHGSGQQFPATPSPFPKKDPR